MEALGQGRTGALHFFRISLQQLVQDYAQWASEMPDAHTAVFSFPSGPRGATQSPSTLIEAVNCQQPYYLKQIQNLS